MFVKLIDGNPVQYPYTEKQFRADYPNTSFPKPLPDAVGQEHGRHPVVTLDQPTHNSATQVVEQNDMPHREGDTWVLWALGWTVRDRTQDELAAHRLEMAERVKDERDRRLPLDFEFNGKSYQRDAISIARISGAGALALGAMMSGAQPGDLRWHGRDTDFVWIASDDTLTPMDAQTCFAFGARAAAVETEIVFAAKALREMDPIPADYADDKYWP